MVSKDKDITIEYWHTSNGWFNAKDGAGDFEATVWSRETKSPDNLCFDLIAETFSLCPEESAIPLFSGISKIWKVVGSDGFHGIQTTDDSLILLLDHSPPVDRIVFQRDQNIVTFNKTRVRDLKADS
mgnify:CR=1 FL=1